LLRGNLPRSLWSSAGARRSEAFEVAVARSRLETSHSSTRRLHLVDIYDETGLLLDRAVRSDTIRTFGSQTPSWLHSRTPRSAAATSIGWGIAGMSGRNPRPSEVVAGPRGIDLGVFREPTESGGQELRLTLGERSSVRCPILAGKEGESFLIAVSVPLARLADRVLLDDGRRALDAGATVRAECTAVVRGDESDAWRNLPIQVWVDLPGWQSLGFAYSVSEGPPPTRELVRADQ
jgi:hypothetical protein